MSTEERLALGASGRGHVMKEYNFAKFRGSWYQLMKETIETMSSWENRKNYKNWSITEL